jgi:hypothetical protein
MGWPGNNTAALGSIAARKACGPLACARSASAWSAAINAALVAVVSARWALSGNDKADNRTSARINMLAPLKIGPTGAWFNDAPLKAGKDCVRKPDLTSHIVPKEPSGGVGALSTGVSRRQRICSPVKPQENPVRASRFFMLSLVIAALLSPFHAGAQKTAASKATQTAVERRLLKLEDNWCKGLVNRDATMFQRLLAPGFIYTENGTMMSRDAVIKSVVNGDKVVRAWNQGMQVHEFGPAAVVTGVLSVTSSGKTGQYTTRYRFTDTWLNKTGAWQLIAAQDYVIPDKPAQ